MRQDRHRTDFEVRRRVLSEGKETCTPLLGSILEVRLHPSDQGLVSLVVLLILLPANSKVVTMILDVILAAVVNHGSVVLLQDSTHHKDRMINVVGLIDIHHFSLLVPDKAGIRARLGHLRRSGHRVADNGGL